MSPASNKRPVLIAIGSSTGGPSTLRLLLSELPGDLPASLVIVQHIPENHAPTLVETLSQRARLKIQVAAPDLPIVPGHVYVAPGGRRNLVIEADDDGAGRLAIQVADRQQSYWPSIDLLFESAARVFGTRVIGVLLSGMGTDGTSGLGAIRQAGGITIAESEQTSVVFGMPKNAIDAGIVEMVLPKERIAAVLWGQSLSMREF